MVETIETEVLAEATLTRIGPKPEGALGLTETEAQEMVICREVEVEEALCLAREASGRRKVADQKGGLDSQVAADLSTVEEVVVDTQEVEEVPRPMDMFLEEEVGQFFQVMQY